MNEELKVLVDLYVGGYPGPWCPWSLYYLALQDGLISKAEYRAALEYYGDSFYHTWVL